MLRHLDAVGAAASAASVVIAPAPVERTEKVRGLQRAMIKTMNASNTIPHFVYSDELNLGRLVRPAAHARRVCTMVSRYSRVFQVRGGVVAPRLTRAGRCGCAPS